MDEPPKLSRRTALTTIAAGTVSGAISIGTASANPQAGCGNRRASRHAVSGNFIRTKVPYRHITARPLPTTADGSIDTEQMVIDVAMNTVHVEPAVRTRALCVVDALQDDDTELAMSRWEDTLRDSKLDGTPLDLNALIQFILREAYLEAASDLRFYAMQVKRFTDQKEELREWLTDARRIQETLPADCGNDQDLCSLKADLERSIDEYTKQLESPCEGDPELANVDLQETMQKQQQTLQMMSKIMKRLHDTAMAIIRNAS